MQHLYESKFLYLHQKPQDAILDSSRFGIFISAGLLYKPRLTGEFLGKKSATSPLQPAQGLGYQQNGIQVLSPPSLVPSEVSGIAALIRDTK